MKTLKENLSFQLSTKIQIQEEKKVLESLRPMRSMIGIKSMRPKNITKSAAVQFRPIEKTF